MNKKLIIMIVSFVCFVGLQASFERPQSKISSDSLDSKVSFERLESRASSERSDSRGWDLDKLAANLKKRADEFETQKKATFFAIKNGLGHDLVQSFVDKTISSSPTSMEAQEFKDDVVVAFKSSSPLVISIKEEMNNGNRNAQQRHDLCGLLREIENLSSIYDGKKPNAQRILHAIEQDFSSIKK